MHTFHQIFHEIIQHNIHRVKWCFMVKNSLLLYLLLLELVKQTRYANMTKMTSFTFDEDI